MNIVFSMGKTMILGLFRQWSIMHIRRVHAKIPSRHWYSINTCSSIYEVIFPSYLDIQIKRLIPE